MPYTSFRLYDSSIICTLRTGAEFKKMHAPGIPFESDKEDYFDVYHAKPKAKKKQRR